MGEVVVGDGDDIGEETAGEDVAGVGILMSSCKSLDQ